MVDQRWVFVVRALDKPGTLTAAAAVFSNRGVSLESLLGSGIAATTAEDGRLILCFRSTEAKQAMLLQALKRVSTVSKVDAYRYDDPHLRSIALARITAGFAFEANRTAVHAETIDRTEDEQVVLLSGSPIAVEAIIDAWRQQDKLHDVVLSTIAV